MLQYMTGVDQRDTGIGKVAEFTHLLAMINVIKLQGIDVDKTWDKLSAATQVQLQFILILAESSGLVRIGHWSIKCEC